MTVMTNTNMKIKIQYPQVKCSYCGKPFKKKHNRQKYCCKECSKNAKREQDRQAWTRWFHKNKQELYAKQLGTRTIGPHKHQDPKREQEIVQNEKQRSLRQASNFFDYNMNMI